MKKLVYALARMVFRIFFPRKPILTATIQRILVIKLCCIGDILFTTPLLRALHAGFPRSRISYMVSSWCKELVLSNPHVHEAIEYNPYDRVSFLEKIRRIIRVVRLLREHKFDVAVILHRTPLAGVLAACAGVPVRIGFDWQGAGFAHTHPVPFHPDVYEMERNLECLAPLDIHSTDLQPELTVSVSADTAANEFLTQLGYASNQGPLVAIFPGGGVNPGTIMYTKRWTLVGYQELCQRLVREQGARVILVGSREDAGIGDKILLGQDWTHQVMRAEGRTTLPLLAALIKKCALFVGGDSGPLHMANAVGTPTVSIFGPTDPNLVAPRGEKHRVIHAPQPCAPCYNPVTVLQSGSNLCQQESLKCMEQISSQEVFAAAAELLGSTVEPK